MKNYTINLYWKEIIIIQNDDWTFNKAQEILDYLWVWTSIKPAHEPICMARKPLAEKTVAENVLKYGTGGINIDESRVETEDELKTQKAKGSNGGEAYGDYNLNATYTPSTLGRFPANLILSDCEEVRECFPESNGQGKHKKAEYNANQPINLGGGQVNTSYEDKGNASRFFKSILYYPKASKSERNKGMNIEKEPNKRPIGEAFGNGNAITDFTETKGNNHPTVKPVALMEYLIKMITPKGWIVLDPFAGSGSTLVAAKQNGYQYVGIEMTEEYIPIIEARLNAVEKNLFN